ncbi:hypothetical protein O1611_g22 [Lasiodiplodia mahajangana]|uniref:Uncharacterized protein n=1 Tax=Lasiodiplodia mahajangana TaxID=1108764 RepID=A0ACC2K1C9_9PEZI|nr:hypothetical protein O1611_g22 [Lasiodiplodia mahajangana]
MLTISSSRATYTGGSSPDGEQNRKQTTYTARLNRLSETPRRPELYSRVQYQFLTPYLSTPPGYTQQTRSGGSAHAQWCTRPNSDAFIHVVVHSFSGGAQLERRDFNLDDGLTRFIDHPQSEANVDQIIFVRGSLSSKWIEALGTKYKIDPEFFRRHLRYLPGRDHSDLPSLPSANTDIMTLKLASLYTRTYTLAPEQIERSRRKDSDVARRNQKSISSNMACGETVIRKFSTLSDRLLSVEHEISIFTRNRKSGGRIAVVLLDNGLEMNEENGPPCFGRQDSPIPEASATGISPIPIIVPRPPTLNINVVHPEVPLDYNSTSPNSISHVASLLPFYIGMSINIPTTPPDVLSLICEVFRLVAGSECQFLNRLRCLVQDLEPNPTDGEDIDLATNTLRYIIELLEDHRQCLKQNIAFLKARGLGPLGGLTPPTSSSSTQTQQGHSPDDLATILIDFVELLGRAESLKELCKETLVLILNGAMLRESQKAIQRADDQKRLTVLAYLFLPISLVFSLFGMNVREFGTGSQSIWFPFVVLAPVGGISWILFRPQNIQQFLTVGRWFRK